MTKYIQDNNHLIKKLLLIRNYGDKKRIKKPSLNAERKKNIPLSTWISISNEKKMFHNNGEIKILSHKGKLKECITNRPVLQTSQQTN